MRNRKGLLAILFAGACLAVLPSCSGLSAQRVAADRATFNWLAPMFRAYVMADPALDEAAKGTHLRVLDAWNERIVAEEGTVGAPIPVPPGGGQ